MVELSDRDLSRYSRHILLDEIDIAGQQALLASRVLMIGAGGLGAAAALYLAAAGVGTLVISDDDSVDLTNLQRQIIHQQSRLGWNKAESAVAQLRDINPDISLLALPHRLEGSALLEQVQLADVVLDCSDNFPTRHQINAACVATKTPLVSGAAVRFHGQLAVFDPASQATTGCYHCLFPAEGDNQDGPCALFGVFSPLVGIIGCSQAAEALKLLLHLPSKQRGRLGRYDGIAGEWRYVNLHADPTCPVCGTKP